MAPVIIMLAVSALVEDERNTKTHTPDQVRQIAASIREFGFNDPIVVDANNVIVEGHGRLLAAKLLDMAEVPCIREEFASVKERRGYAIAHNRTQQLTRLDEGLVLAELDRVGADTGLTEAAGFTDDEIAFIRFREEGGFEGGSSGGGSGGGSSSQFAAGKSITSRIDFANQEQLVEWLDGLDWLRSMYPEAMTVAERLQRAMDDFSGAL